jgi:myo-inositol-1(or 4)-monophosphatase
LHSHEGIENLTSELEAALSAAKQAGEVLRAGFGAEHAITYKGEVDLVTEVDEAAERVIREELLGTFPTHGMLGEEGGELEGREDARWIVDPLDGTTNYAHGLPIFCVERAEEILEWLLRHMRQATRELIGDDLATEDCAEGGIARSWGGDE